MKKYINTIIKNIYTPKLLNLKQAILGTVTQLLLDHNRNIGK